MPCIFSQLPKALPSPLGALSAGPGKTVPLMGPLVVSLQLVSSQAGLPEVHWFLAVNSRTAAASAAAAFLLPRVGLVWLDMDWMMDYSAR